MTPTSTRNAGIAPRGVTTPLCQDEPYARLKPVVPWTVGPPANDYRDPGRDRFDVGTVPSNGQPPPLYGEFVRWAIGAEPLWLNFSDPTILHTARPPAQFDPKTVVIPEAVPQDAWVYFLIIGNQTALDRTDPNRTIIPAAHPVRPLSQA